MRLVALVVGGLFLLLVATNDNSTIDYFCKRYQGVKYADLDKPSTKEIETSSYEITTCRDDLRFLGWLVYFPIVAFNLHCLRTLYAYRKSHENKEF